MFFRRPKPKVQTYAERLQQLRSAGFALEDMRDGLTRVVKNGVAAFIQEGHQGHPSIDRAGVLLGAELAVPVSHGYQMFLETQTGKRMPAQAEQLKALHEFEADLKEALDVTDLYNTSLGTTSKQHAYDRVAGYGAKEHKLRPWEKRQPSA